MAQVDREERLKSSRGEIFNQYNKNLGTATTASFVNLLTIDATPIRSSVFVIHNRTAGDLDFEILGNAETDADITAPTGTNDDDKGWVVLNTGSIATTVAPTVVAITDPYTQLVVRAKHTTTTTTVDIWHRGEN